MVSVKHLETVPSATSVFWEEIPRRWGPWLELLKSFDHVKWICCASTYKDFWREEVLWCLFYVDFMMGIIFFNIYTCYLAFCVGWGASSAKEKYPEVSFTELFVKSKSEWLHLCFYISTTEVEYFWWSQFRRGILRARSCNREIAVDVSSKVHCF